MRRAQLTQLQIEINEKNLIFGTDVVQSWAMASHEILAHITACMFEHRRDIAQQTSTYIYVRKATEPGLRVRIIAIYRVPTINDDHAFTDLYYLNGKATRLDRSVKTRMRIFVSEIVDGVCTGFRSLLSPIACVGLHVRDPVTEGDLIRLAEAGLTTLEHVGAAVGGAGWTSRTLKSDLPDLFGDATYSDIAGHMARMNGLTRFSPLPVYFTNSGVERAELYRNGERMWMDVPADQVTPR